jgi:hypothetical protein
MWTTGREACRRRLRDPPAGCGLWTEEPLRARRFFRGDRHVSVVSTLLPVHSRLFQAAIVIARQARKSSSAPRSISIF